MKRTSIKPKLKKCRSCKAEFSPRCSLDKVCSVTCAIKDTRDTAAANQKKQDGIRKELLKSRGDFIEEAQIQFNRFIRIRDIGQVCISCQKPPKKKNAGHYRGRGAAPELRFNELNVHLQCEHCNSHLSSNAIEYRINLVKKIGIEKVEWLEGPHEPAKLSIQDIKDIKKKYSALSRELEKAQLEQS